MTKVEMLLIVGFIFMIALHIVAARLFYIFFKWQKTQDKAILSFFDLRQKELMEEIRILEGKK